MSTHPPRPAAVRPPHSAGASAPLGPALGLMALGLLACADLPGVGPDAQGLHIEVAALSLEGVDVACYDLRVDTATETVWRAGDPTLKASDGDTGALCSDLYGFAGGISYVGTCDASADADVDPATPGVQNTVTLWVDGLYRGGYGDALIPIEDDGVSAWQDPCGEHGCVMTFDCVENADTEVHFDLTVMRSAQQGFLDVVVSFDDVFCSAKYDTCYADASGAPADPIHLLFGASGGRQHTGVMALACAAAPGTSVGTELHLSAMVARCVNADGNELVFPIRPESGPGNVETGGTWGRTSDESPPTTESPSETFRYATFFGDESLSCEGASCQKKYWNVAFNLGHLEDQDLRGCRLRAAGTATRSDRLVFGPDGQLAEGVTAYPIITFGPTDDGATDLPLTDAAGSPPCVAEPLNVAGSAVQTGYLYADGGWPAASPSDALCHVFPAGATEPSTLAYAGSDCEALDDLIPPGPTAFTMPQRALCEPGAQAGEPTVLGTLGDASLTEVSGVVPSPSQPGVLWVHNDSGHGPYLHALAPDGAYLGRVELPFEPDRLDFEDIAAAPCPDASGPCLYLADTGNNNWGGDRDNAAVFAIPEPQLPAGGVFPAGFAVTEAQRVDVSTHSGMPLGMDIEALVVLPDASAMLLIEKVDASEARVFAVRAPFQLQDIGAGSPFVDGPPADVDPAAVETLGTLALPFMSLVDDLAFAKMVTGADLHPSGRALAVRTYTGVFEARLPEGLSAVDGILSEPFERLVIGPMSEPQGEAIAYDEAGDGLITISEIGGEYTSATEIPINHFACL